MGYVQTSSGKVVSDLNSTYRRNGTLNLFAALNVATGEVIKKTTKTKTRVDLQAFMDEILPYSPDLNPTEMMFAKATLRQGRRANNRQSLGAHRQNPR
jgi:transposase